MGRVTDISEFTGDVVEESGLIEIGTVNQEHSNDKDWFGSNEEEPEKPAAPVGKALEDDGSGYEDPTGDPDATEAAAPSMEGTVPETTAETAGETTEAAEEALQIFHDHDNDSETDLVAVDDTITLAQVSEGDTYQLYCEEEGDVIWGSSDPDIAEVDPVTGLVTFTGAEGEVEISAHLVESEESDTVTFSTAAAAPAAAEEEASGGIGSILPYILIGLLSLVIIIMMIQRSVEKKRREEARRRRNAKKRRNAEQGHTEVQTGPVAVPVEIPVEDAVAAIQPHAGVRSAVFQAIGARKDQQDSYGMTDPALYAQQGVLALVADGMGGLANGKAVSATLVNTFLADFRMMAERETPQDALMKLSINANQRINQMLVGADRSGSTLISCIVKDGCLYFLTVGDSRIYLYRGGALLQLNREHIYQEELAVKAVNCQVPISQVTGDRQAHALTSFFGNGSITHMDRNYEGIRLLPGDRVLLCSDGVFGTLTQAQMEYAMNNDVKTAADMLKDMVRDAGKPHQDNNTGLILEYLG